jgi:hypothetical protein
MMNRHARFIKIFVGVLLCILFAGSAYLFMSILRSTNEPVTVFVAPTEDVDITKVEGVVIKNPKDSNVEPETDTTEIISDDTVEVVEADIIEPLVEHELTDTGIDWEAAKPVGNGYTGITLASELPDKIIDNFVWHINKEYANHPIPELRRYAELSPKIFRGEPLNLNEMYDFVKAMYIVNPTDATLKELEKYEKRLLAQTFERQRTR